MTVYCQHVQLTPRGGILRVFPRYSHAPLGFFFVSSQEKAHLQESQLNKEVLSSITNNEMAKRVKICGHFS